MMQKLATASCLRAPTPPPRCATRPRAWRRCWPDAAPTVFSLMQICSATCLLVAPPATRRRISISRRRQAAGRAVAADLCRLDAELGVDVLRGGRVGGGQLVVAECLVRHGHPLVDLGRLVARLLRAVLPQRGLQRVERIRRGVPAAPVSRRGRAPPMRGNRACRKPRRRIRVRRNVFRLRQGCHGPAQPRRLRAATASGRFGPLLPVRAEDRSTRCRDRPCGSAAAPHRAAARCPAPAPCANAANAPSASPRKPAHLAELVVALTGRPDVDVLQRPAGGGQPVLEPAVIVGCGEQLQAVHIADAAVGGRRGEIVAPALHRLRPGPHAGQIGQPMAVMHDRAIDVTGPLDRHLTGEHRQHRLVEQRESLRSSWRRGSPPAPRPPDKAPSPRGRRRARRCHATPSPGSRAPRDPR